MSILERKLVYKWGSMSVFDSITKAEKINLFSRTYCNALCNLFVFRGQEPGIVVKSLAFLLYIQMVLYSNVSLETTNLD
jgi:hypothetical protein